MIFITGCARSGTSLTTKILKAHGCYLGQPEHVNSLYENTDIREKVVKKYLRAIGVDPLGQHPLPDTWNLPPLPSLKGEVFSRIPEQYEPCAYKCAKLVLIWPLWAEAFPDAKYIIVRRDREKIIDSCMRTGFMQRRTTRAAWGEWVDRHEAQFHAMSETLDTLEVWTDDVIADADAFKPVAEFAGLDFRRDLVGHAIDRKAWHTTEEKGGINAVIDGPRP